MKKFLCVLISVILMVSALGGCVFDQTAQTAVTELLAYTPEDRANMVSIALPMLVTDTGLDLATDLIVGYNPNSNSIYNTLLRQVFAFIDQETLLCMVEQMYKIDESLRNKYLAGFQNRVEAQLSPSAYAAMENMMEKEYAEVEGLEQICTEDGITAGVVAHFMGLFVELNGGAALFTDENISKFKVSTISPLLAEIYMGMTGEPEGAQTAMETMAKKLNGHYTLEERQQLKLALAELGIYAPNAATDGIIGGGAVDSERVEPQQDGFGYKVLAIDETFYDTIEVAYYDNGEAVWEKALTEPLKIAVPVNTANVMLYRMGESFTPIKYTSYADGMLYCVIDKVGTYALCKVAPYFTDANGWGKDYIEALYRRGIISGKGDGIFAPEAQITREEFVKLATEMFDLKAPNANAGFIDVSVDAWYAPYIAAAKHHGIVNGLSAVRFGVGEPITRQDMSKILYGMLEKMELVGESADAPLVFNDAEQIAPYAQDAVRELVGLGIISGDTLGNFNPQANATRQEAAKLIYGMLALYVR